MPRRRPATTLASVCASALALAALATGCSADSGKATAEPSTGAHPSASGGYVSQHGMACADAVHKDDVAALLPPGDVTVHEEQHPEKDYPILRCEVTSGSGPDTRTFTGSAYLFNTAGTGLVQLPGVFGSDAVPFGGGGDAMTSRDDAFLIQQCRVQGVADPVPILVRAQLSGSPTADRRDELAHLTVQLAHRVSDVAQCATPAPDEHRIDPLAEASEAKPVTAATPGCGVLDGSQLNQAAGTWMAALTQGGGPVQACDLFLDGRRVVRFTLAYGWLAPNTETPGERGSLTERLAAPDSPGDLPDPGPVLAAVDIHQTAAYHNTLVAVRMSRLDGTASTTDVHGTPVEQLFRTFVAKTQTSRADLAPVPADAVWTFAPPTR